MACNKFGQEKTFCMTDMRFNNENIRLLYRAILWTVKRIFFLKKHILQISIPSAITIQAVTDESLELYVILSIQTQVQFNILKANLILNTKYIEISNENLVKSINNSISNKDLHNIIHKRLISAFSSQSYHVIEESFVINTLKKDYELSDYDAQQFLTNMRLLSITNANNKINKSLDSRLHRDLFETDIPSC